MQYGDNAIYKICILGNINIHISQIHPTTDEPSFQKITSSVSTATPIDDTEVEIATTRFIPWSWVDIITITDSPGNTHEVSSHSSTTDTIIEPTGFTQGGSKPTSENSKPTVTETPESTDEPSPGITEPTSIETSESTEPSPGITEPTSIETTETTPGVLKPEITTEDLEPDLELETEPGTSAGLEIISSGSDQSNELKGKPLSQSSFYPQNAAWEVESVVTTILPITTPSDVQSTLLPTTPETTTSLTSIPSEETTTLIEETTTGIIEETTVLLTEETVTKVTLSEELGTPTEETVTVTEETGTLIEETDMVTFIVEASTPTAETTSVFTKQSLEEELEKLLDHNTKLVDIIRATLQVQFTLFSRIISYILPSS